MTEADGNLSATPAATPKDHPQLQKTVITHRKNLRYPEKTAKNHENMAKRAKNVLLAIPSGGGDFYIFVAMVKS